MKRILTPVFLIFLLSGCGMSALQKQQVGQFGVATEAVGTYAENEFPKIRSEVISLSTERLILSKEKITSLRTTYEKELQFDTKHIKLVDTNKRVAAAKALRAYGALLNQLATSDNTDSIKAAAANLVTNFSSAIEGELSSKQKDAANSLITLVGNIWLENEKKEALKRIIDAYKDDVDKLSDLLLADFSIHEDPEKGGYLDDYNQYAVRLENTAINVFAEGEPSFAARKLAINDFILAKKTEQNIENINHQATPVILDLKKANAKLVEIMASDSYSTDDIQAFAKSAQNLVNLTQTLLLNK